MSVDYSHYKEAETYYIMKGLSSDHSTIVFMGRFVDYSDKTAFNLESVDGSISEYYIENIIEKVTNKKRYSHWAALLGPDLREILSHKRVLFKTKWYKEF